MRLRGLVCSLPHLIRLVICSSAYSILPATSGVSVTAIPAIPVSGPGKESSIKPLLCSPFFQPKSSELIFEATLLTAQRMLSLSPHETSHKVE